jgi:Bacterial proteasome activator
MVSAAQRASERPQAGPAPRVIIVVGGPARAGVPCRVEAPDRVLRMFGLLVAVRDHVDLAAMPPEDRVAVQHLIKVVSGELERSVSPPLAEELCNFVRFGEGPPSAAELRIEYAGLLGWASGLVVAMLDQLSAACDRGSRADTQAGTVASVTAP